LPQIKPKLTNSRFATHSFTKRYYPLNEIKMEMYINELCKESGIYLWSILWFWRWTHPPLGKAKKM